MEKVFSRVLITDDYHRVLVIQQKENVWYFPGGKQEKGETPLECAKREVKEEVDLNVHELTELYQGHFVFNEISWYGYFYFAESVSGVPKINESDKINEIKFIDDLEGVDFSEPLSEVIQYLLNNKLLKTKSTLWV